MALVNVLRNHVPTNIVPRYERLVRFVAERAHGDKATLPWTARVSTGSQGRMISFVTTAEGFAELAAREQPDDMIRRLFGEGDGNALLEALGEGVQTSYLISNVRDDLSSQTIEQAQPSPLALVSRLRAVPGRGPDLEELIRKVVEAARKIDDQRRYLVMQTVVGGPSQYSIAQPVEDPAQLDRQAPIPELLTEAFGASDADKIYREGTAAVQEAQSELSVVRPDLSHQS